MRPARGSGTRTIPTKCRFWGATCSEGVGFWLAYNGGTPQLRIGNPSGNRVAWDGTDLTLVSQNLTIDSTGINIVGSGSYDAARSYHFTTGTETGALFGLYPYDSGSGTRSINVLNAITSNGTAQTTLSAKAPGAQHVAQWSLNATYNSAPTITGISDLTHYGLVWLRSGSSYGTGSGLRVDSDSAFGRAAAAGYRLIVKGSGTTSATFGLLVQDSAEAATMYIRNDGYGYLKAAAWVYGSDRRLKDRIEYFSNGLDVIRALRPARFDYRNGLKGQLGFIAQDVQGVIPEAISVTDPETGLLGLRYGFVLPFAVNAIQELEARAKAMEARLALLEKR